MRRSSVIGPLILIGIGALFLIRNIRPELQLVHFLATSWPFILVAWGGLRLLELFYWFSKGQPLPENGMAGGEWFLVVLFSLGGSGLFVAQNRTDWLTNAHIKFDGIELFDDAYEFPITHPPVKAESAQRLVIENFLGNAQITGADTNEIRISGKKKIRTSQQSDADKYNQETPLEVIVKGGVATLRCNQDRVKQSARVSDSLEIVVPRAFAIQAAGREGDFNIRDINGAVDVHSENAGVRLDNLAGPVKVYTRKSDTIHAVGLRSSLELTGGGSDIELENIAGQVSIEGSYSGTTQLRALAKPIRIVGQRLDFRAEAIPGEIRATLSELEGTGVAGPITISSKHSRDVHLTGFTQGIQIDLKNGNVTLDPGQTKMSHIDVRVQHGDIELGLPPKGFRLKASSNRGETNTEDWGEMPIVSEKRRTSIDYSAGEGPELFVHTDHGKMTVRKSESVSNTRFVPAAPTPPPEPPAAPLLLSKPPLVRVE